MALRSVTRYGFTVRGILLSRYMTRELSGSFVSRTPFMAAIVNDFKRFSSHSSGDSHYYVKNIQYTSNLFSKVHNIYSWKNPFISRSITKGDETDKKALPPKVYWNPILRRGSNNPILITEMEESLFISIDVPGIEKEGVKVLVKNDDLEITAKEGPKDLAYDREVTEPRAYRCELYVASSKFKNAEIKARINNGVLRLTIPKVQIQENNGDSKEAAGKFHRRPGNVIVDLRQPRDLRDIVENFVTSKNPFMENGPEEGFTTKDDGEARYLRVDMPGVDKDDLNLRYEDRKNDPTMIELILEAEEKENSANSVEEFQRSYGVSWWFRKVDIKMDEIKAVISCGVVRIRVPKLTSGPIFSQVMFDLFVRSPFE